MRRKALWTTTGVLLGLVSATSVARADDTRRAAELYEMGNKLFDEQKWAEAEAAYQAAWDLRKSFDLAGNLADVEMQLGQNRDAAEHFQYAYENFPTGGKPEVREALGKRLEEVKKLVGIVTITTNIGGAKLFVDGKMVGQAPLSQPIYVDPGQRVIEARLEGYDDALRTINVEKAQTQDVSLVLAPKIASSSKSNKNVAIIVAGAGLGAVGIGTGIGLLIAASSADADAEQIRNSFTPAEKGACPGTGETATKCANLKDRLESKDTFTNAGVPVLVIGSLLAVGTVAYALWPKKKSAAATLEIAPVVAPTFAGFSAAGHF